MKNIRLMLNDIISHWNKPKLKNHGAHLCQWISRNEGVFDLPLICSDVRCPYTPTLQPSYLSFSVCFQLTVVLILLTFLLSSCHLHDLYFLDTVILLFILMIFASFYFQYLYIKGHWDVTFSFFSFFLPGYIFGFHKDIFFLMYLNLDKKLIILKKDKTN